MEKIEETTMDMRIKSISTTEISKEDGDTIVHRLVAKDKDGLNELVIKSAYPFKGLSAKTGVVQIVIKNSQLTIEDFKKDKEEKQEPEE